MSCEATAMACPMKINDYADYRARESFTLTEASYITLGHEPGNYFAAGQDGRYRLLEAAILNRGLKAQIPYSPMPGNISTALHRHGSSLDADIPKFVRDNADVGESIILRQDLDEFCKTKNIANSLLLGSPVAMDQTIQPSTESKQPVNIPVLTSEKTKVRARGVKVAAVQEAMVALGWVGRQPNGVTDDRALELVNGQLKARNVTVSLKTLRRAMAKR